MLERFLYDHRTKLHMDPKDPDFEDEPCEGAEWQHSGFEGYSDDDDLRICDEIDRIQSAE